MPDSPRPDFLIPESRILATRDLLATMNQSLQLLAGAAQGINGESAHQAIQTVHRAMRRLLMHEVLFRGDEGDIRLHAIE